MSKTSLKNKELKARSKAKSSEKRPTESTPTQAAETKLPNYGKCCSCKYYPKHIHGQAQPCKKLNNYVARKAEHPCWTAK